MSIDLLFADFDRLIQSPESVHRLRRFILDLAVRGKLVPQDPNDEPASELLKRIALEKARLVKAGKIRKPKKIPLIDCSSLLFGAPLGWAWARLSEISRKIHYGFTASAIQQIDDVRLLRITDIQHNKVEWHSVPGCEIDKEAIPNFKLETGDILIARTGGTIGKSFLVAELPVAAVFASYLIRVQGSHEIYARYLKLFLESPIYWTQLREGARGAGQPNVNGQTLGTMLVPLPPLAEQHRIVAKVDELMAFCDRLEAARAEREATRDRLATASLASLNAPNPNPAMFQHDVAFALNNLTPLTTRPDQIKALRQTMLNLAVRGKLLVQEASEGDVDDLLDQLSIQRKRLIARKKLKRSVVTCNLENQDNLASIPNSWRWVPLGKLISFGPQNGISPRATNSTDTPRAITLTATTSGTFDASHFKHVEADVPADSEYWLRDGDLLFQRGNTREYVGIAAYFSGASGIFLYPDLIIKVRLLNGLYLPYVHLALVSPGARTYFSTNATGAQETMPKINQQTLLNAPVPLPPLAEQHRIVTKVDELMALCDRLEASLVTGGEARGRLVEAVLYEPLAAEGDRRRTISLSAIS